MLFLMSSPSESWQVGKQPDDTFVKTFRSHKILSHPCSNTKIISAVAQSGSVLAKATDSSRKETNAVARCARCWIILKSILHAMQEKGSDLDYTPAGILKSNENSDGQYNTTY